MGIRGKRLSDLVVDRYVNLELFNRQQRTTDTGCIEWTGVTSNIGYGFIGFRHVDPATGAPQKGAGGMMTTHRLAFMIANNRLPAKRNVNHTCHNKLCINPQHLTEGTQREKLDAMVRDQVHGGRRKGQTGFAYNHKQTKRNYKYSEEEIQWIRTADTRDISARYGLARDRACAMRCSFRMGYQWLPVPDIPYPKGKTGRKKAQC